LSGNAANKGKANMYTVKNFRSKKELKKAIANGEKIRYFQPGPFGGNEPHNGTFCLEGPHYPEPHRWYATAKAENGLIVSLK
jgi:hypothetical protein